MSGMLFLTLLRAGGVLLLRLRQAGVVSRLAQSVKPEPLKSEADGHGSPERSAVGVVGLG